jgi:double-stranded uracil-DNA glycosylase
MAPKPCSNAARFADVTRVRSFPPVAARNAEMLVLGSMPGVASLRAGRYYAHPQNAFWPIMGQLLGFDPAITYSRRIAALKIARIALWDVLHSCAREGSLDTRIEDELANDFDAFFHSHPRIERVYFNGAKAEQFFRRHVLSRGTGAGLRYERLPSTSPANASWPRARKVEAWRRALAGAPGQLRVSFL